MSDQPEFDEYLKEILDFSSGERSGTVPPDPVEQKPLQSKKKSPTEQKNRTLELVVRIIAAAIVLVLLYLFGMNVAYR